MPNFRTTARRGAVLPLTVLCLVILIGMVALAVDLSLLALARTQAQNAADAAAMAATRTLNGDSSTNNNIDAALTNGKTAAKQGTVVGQPLTDSQLDVEIGVLNSISAAPFFSGSNFTASAAAPPSGSNWGMAKATVTGSMNTNFATVFGIASLPYAATAQAIHRPRDVAIILDFSGSMAFDSYMAAPPTGADPGQTWSPYSATNPAGPATSLNPDTLVPKFGHYDPNTASGTYASLISDGTSFTWPTGEILKPGNTTTGTTSGLALTGDFLTQAAGGMVSAFTASSSPTPVTSVDGDNFPTSLPNGAGGSSPGGDRPLKVNQNSGPAYAKNVLEFLNLGTSAPANYQGKSTTFEGSTGVTDTAYGGKYAGFTFGPGQWGKTFFVWPPYPDPTTNPLVSSTTVNDNTTNGPGGGPIRDWRQRFYWMVNTSTNQKKRLDDNNVLWNSNGTMKPPGTTTKISGSPVSADNGTWKYQINYEAVLAWLQNTGPNPIPANLRSGRILYYTSIPTGVTSASTDYDQLFWKNYIDYVFGVRSYGTASGSPAAQTLLSGFGSDFSWSTASAPTGVNPKPADLSGSPSPPAFMDYRDNPVRPKMRYWFGPMSVVDFLWDDFDTVNHYWRPGTCHEAPMWALKAGVQSALQDIQKNHPNDWVTLIYFCVPKGSASDGFGQRFNRVRAPLGKQYTQMVNALWYPPTVLDSSGNLIPISSTSPPGEIRPWDLSMNPTAVYNETPMAQGGTSPSMAFMLAYNQFSSAPSLPNYASTNGLPSAPAGDAGGNGRRGARKMIVFETDGVPNITTTASFTNGGAYNSFYNIRQPVEYPTLAWTSNLSTQTLNATYDALKAICNYPTADRPGYNPSSGPALPGYSTQGKPVLVHTLAFGFMFEGSSSLKSQALAYLQQIQTYGGTQQSSSDPLPNWKVVIGTSDQQSATLKAAFTNIMQDGVQVSLFN